jgi:hypothetical protein
MCWIFFAFSHGKVEVDGVGAFLKREIRKGQIKPNAVRLQNAHNIVTFCWHQVNMVAQLYYLHLG